MQSEGFVNTARILNHVARDQEVERSCSLLNKSRSQNADGCRQFAGEVSANAPTQCASFRNRPTLGAISLRPRVTEEGSQEGSTSLAAMEFKACRLGTSWRSQDKVRRPARQDPNGSFASNPIGLGKRQPHWGLAHRRPSRVGQHDVCVCCLTGRRGTELLAAWSGPGEKWSTSLPLAIGQNEKVASFGVGQGRTAFALLRGASGAERLALAQAGGTECNRCRRLPRGRTRSPLARGGQWMRSSPPGPSFRPGLSRRVRRDGLKTRSWTSPSSTAPRRDQGSQSPQEGGARRMRGSL